MKPQLTVDQLRSAGFEVLGEWQVDDVAIRHGLNLPQRAGVYAFAIDGVVQYVGVASRSIKQRLGFYQKPGVSQRTNIRLNERIRAEVGEGGIVQILVAHPPDVEWNGLKVCGSEGLEAGLISEFDLPWNMRAASPQAAPVAPDRAKTARQGGVRERILAQISKRPGMTELELAKHIYGPSASQPQVNPQCRALVTTGLVERRGSGGREDPFTYYPRMPRR